MLLSLQTFASEVKSNSFETSSIQNVNINLNDVTENQSAVVESVLNETLMPSLNNLNFAQCTFTLSIEVSVGVVSVTGSVSVTGDCRNAYQQALYYKNLIEYQLRKQIQNY